MARSRNALCALVLVATTLLLGNAASAGQQWCEEDPEFLVNGGLVDVTTAFDGAYAGSVKGPVTFDLQVPVNATAAVVALPGSVPLTATISHALPAYYGIGSVPVVVTVTVKASASFDTYTTATGTTGALTWTVGGKSNSSTKVKFSLIGL